MVGEERGITGPFLGSAAKLGSLSGQSHKNQLSSPSKFVDFDSISSPTIPGVLFTGRFFASSSRLVTLC